MLFREKTVKDLISIEKENADTKELIDMDKNDFIISPRWTRANLRGNRIYPTSINYLASVIRRNNENANIY